MNKYVHVFLKDDYVCLYNALTMEVAYLNRQDYEDNIDSNLLQSLLPKDFIGDQDYMEIMKSNLEQKLEPNISTMFLFLNETCNIKCKYCRYMNKLPSNFQGTILDVNKGKQQIQRFLTKSDFVDQRKTIVFFGTEVLLHKDILKELIEYVRDIDAECGLKSTELILFTNGTLLTEKIILVLKENHVVPIISIDGWKELHDKARVNRNGEGTFNLIVNNCNAMKEHGLRFGISLAVGEHNIDYLPQIIEYFSKQFDPINIGINPMEINQVDQREIFFEKFINQGIESFKIARELNISIPQIMRRIRPFVEKKQRIKECPTCGGSIRVYPTGKIGTCSHFVAVNQHCMTESEFMNENFEQHEVIQTWSHRTQFQINQCQTCEAIGLCGGGCVYNAWLQNGDIMKPDYRICTHSKIALKWCIWELFARAKGDKVLKEKRVFVPDLKARKLVYGRLDETKLDLPLQQYNTYGEVQLLE